MIIRPLDALKKAAIFFPLMVIALLLLSLGYKTDYGWEGATFIAFVAALVFGFGTTIHWKKRA